MELNICNYIIDSRFFIIYIVNDAIDFYTQMTVLFTLSMSNFTLGFYTHILNALSNMLEPS